MLISFEQKDLHQIFLNRVLYDCFKLVHAYSNEGDKVRECYNCLKMMIQAYLHVVFFHTIIKRASLIIYETVAIKHNF